MMQLKMFYDIKAWLDPMIGLPASLWLEEGAIIQKKKMYISTRFRFGYICYNLMPSQNESILQHSKVALDSYIMDHAKIKS